MNTLSVNNYGLIDDCHYVDSDFVNFCKSLIPNSELKHISMGDFLLKTADGIVYFYRMNSKPSPQFDKFVGRVHRMMDDCDGFLISQLLAKIESK